jgi:hypothetical protein
MREITLKELAAYLPYNAKVLNGWGDVKTLNYSFLDDENSGIIRQCKPILIPISEIQEDIEYKGKTINVFDLMNEYWEVEFNGVTHDFELPFNGFGLITLSAEQLPYNLVQTLLEYHFDVFGLIDDNLAIPVTKDFNPYE